MLLTDAPSTSARRSFGAAVRLRNGHGLAVRRLLPDDKAELAAAILRLSPQSRYQRFLSPRQRFSDRELTALTSLDGRRRDAVIALDPATQQIIGVARFAELPDDPATADVAITVADCWQGQGLGGALLDVLIERASAAGFVSLHADVLAENRVVQQLLRSRGFRSTRLSGTVREFARALTGSEVARLLDDRALERPAAHSASPVGKAA